MAQALEDVLAQADAEALPPAKVVQQLLEEEWRHRHQTPFTLPRYASPNPNPAYLCAINGFAILSISGSVFFSVEAQMPMRVGLKTRGAR
jgi:hypothetical protein